MIFIWRISAALLTAAPSGRLPALRQLQQLFDRDDQDKPPGCQQHIQPGVFPQPLLTPVFLPFPDGKGAVPDGPHNVFVGCLPQLAVVQTLSGQKLIDADVKQGGNRLQHVDIRRVCACFPAGHRFPADAEPFPQRFLRQSRIPPQCGDELSGLLPIHGLDAPFCFCGSSIPQKMRKVHPKYRESPDRNGENACRGLLRALRTAYRRRIRCIYWEQATKNA